MGKNQLRLLKFALTYYYGKDSWTSYATDPKTKRAINGLVAKGLIRTNEFGQFQAIVGPQDEPETKPTSKFDPSLTDEIGVEEVYREE